MKDMTLLYLQPIENSSSSLVFSMTLTASGMVCSMSLVKADA